MLSSVLENFWQRTNTLPVHVIAVLVQPLGVPLNTQRSVVGGILLADELDIALELESELLERELELFRLLELCAARLELIALDLLLAAIELLDLLLLTVFALLSARLETWITLLAAALLKTTAWLLDAIVRLLAIALELLLTGILELLATTDELLTPALELGLLLRLSPPLGTLLILLTTELLTLLAPPTPPLLPLLLPPPPPPHAVNRNTLTTANTLILLYIELYPGVMFEAGSTVIF